MGTTKTELFNTEQNEIAALLKAIAQPTISQHLKELKNAGMIKGSIEGTSICYCAEKSTVQRLQEYFAGISLKLENRENSCC